MKNVITITKDKIYIPENSDYFPKDFITTIMNNSNTLNTENTLLTQLLLDVVSKKEPYYWLNNKSYLKETSTEIILPKFSIKVQRNNMDYIINYNEDYVFQVQRHETFNKILFLNIIFKDNDPDIILIMEANINNAIDRNAFISAYNSNDYNSIFNNANNILINNLGTQAGDLYFPILIKLNTTNNTYTIDLRSKLNDYMNYISSDSVYQVKFLINEPVIEVRDSQSNLIKPNEDGIYILPTGNYTYTITKPGYQTKTGSFTVGDSDQEINITLTESV
jgi:hypothetical protein